jgi:hypothetical protein
MRSHVDRLGPARWRPGRPPGFVAAAGLEASAWTPREPRYSFVSVLSSIGMPVKDISRLVGHANTRVAELVYRKELRLSTRGTSAMDALFGDASGRPPAR